MTDPRDCTVLYKILLPVDYASLPSKSGETWPGAGIDLADGFIHLSTSEQLPGTLRRFFAAGSPGIGDTVHVLALPRKNIAQKTSDGSEEKLRFEPAVGTVFGHIYGPIEPASYFSEHHQLTRGADGEFALPSLTF
ncbi:unnamed protein product [Parajaminaea phylloscopi]